MPHAGSADVLDIAVGAGKVRVHRAMKELRQAFLKLSSVRGVTAGGSRNAGELS